MKGKRTLAIFMLCLVMLVSLTTPIVAYMIRQTSSIDNEFLTAEVSCSVVESFEDGVKSSVKVSNDGNIDVYVRIRFVSYWVDQAGNQVSKPSPALDLRYDDTTWIKSPHTDTYYHKHPVSAGSLTSELLLEDFSLLTDGEFRQVVEVFAEAIQANPTSVAEGADVWNVQIENGMIINVMN